MNPPITNLATALDIVGPASQMREETVVQMIQHEVETQRLAIVRVDACDRSYLVLQQQEWAAGIGWFTQKSVEIDACQLGPLRCSLQQCQDCKSSPNKRIVAARASHRGLRVVS